MPAAESFARSARRRAREEITLEIVETARRQLATEGAVGLSLRAVARELGMVSSAVYRYVASRDELLTLLITDGYNALGAAVEQAEQAVPRPDLVGRWLALCHAVRDWSLASPHEYALLYGSPVPGYVAPQDTVQPATRVTRVLIGVLAEAVSRDPGVFAGLADPPPDDVRRSIREIRRYIPGTVPDEVVIRGLMAWTYIFGSISFELFGHREQVIDADPLLRRAFFDAEMRRIGALTGLPTGDVVL